ncbi:MAG: mechanosensitive ion channel family protein [Myxococcales bacterium]|nr:mechanosensitive ion channel family protein [Myxococcales bacterium]
MRRLLAVFLVLAGLFASGASARADEHDPRAQQPDPAPSAAPAPSAPAPSAPGAPASRVTSEPPPTVPSASAAPSGSTVPKGTEVAVRIKDRKVFGLFGKNAADRAKHASHALERAFDAAGKEPVDVRYVLEKGVAIVYAGKTPIVEVDEADARAAGAATLEAYAADLTTKVQTALNQEKKRSQIANTVFGFSLVVFTALIAFLLLGKASELAGRAQNWVEDNPERMPSVRLGGIELMRPAALEAVATLAIDAGKRILQFGVLYAWLLFALSLFDATKGYTDRLTSLVLGPLSGLLTRLGTGLPMAVVFAIAALAVVLLVRFTAVFFAGVARGETTLDWVPQDLAHPVGILVRIGIVVAAIVLAAPLLTGTDDGALSRAGIAILAAFGLSATPVIACGVVGSLVVFDRRLRPGDFVEVGGRTGRVRAVSLLEVHLEDEHGCEVRVPHVLSLWHPTRVMGPSPVVAIELVVDPKAEQVKVRDVLSEAARKVGTNVRVDLTSIDADGALYRVTLGVATQLLGPMVSPTGKRTRTPARLASTRVATLPHGAPEKHPSIPPMSMAGLPRMTIPGMHDPRIVPLGVTTTVQLTSLLADALAREGIGLGRRSRSGGP